jgi:acyl-CoA synthetase (AMP-forming)/AMP-acid ligase II
MDVVTLDELVTYLESNGAPDRFAKALENLRGNLDAPTELEAALKRAEEAEEAAYAAESDKEDAEWRAEEAEEAACSAESDKEDAEWRAEEAEASLQELRDALGDLKLAVDAVDYLL